METISTKDAKARLHKMIDHADGHTLASILESLCPLFLTYIYEHGEIVVLEK